MGRHKTIPLKDLGAHIRRLSREVPRAVERGLRESALMLKGPLIQGEIARAHPQPVDQGQYKAAWWSRDVDGGAVVYSTSMHAYFVERGRRPGRAPPLSPIREWVRRKGLWKAEAAKRKTAQGRSRKAPRRGSTGAALPPLGRSSAGRATAGRRSRQSAKDLKEQAIETVARAVQRKIGRAGTKGTAILWLAIRRLQPKLPGIIKRSIMELQP